MFQVTDKNNQSIVRTVYKIDETKDGSIVFLLYDESLSKWLWESADYYKPIFKE
jgi:hypothetical protein